MQVIGHAGAAALAPGNSWPAIEAAIDCGVDAVEVDLRATRDRVIVLFHDESLSPSTDGTGLLREKTWEQIRSVDAGFRYRKAFRPTPIPSLAGTLDRFGRAVPFVLELKEAGLVDDVLGLVHCKALKRECTLTSFLFDVLTEVKEKSPGQKVGFLTHSVDSETVERVRMAGFEQFCPPAADLNRARVSSWKKMGLEVRCWGVYSDDLMLQAVEAGVDGMTINDPRRLLRALGRWSGPAFD